MIVRYIIVETHFRHALVDTYFSSTPGTENLFESEIVVHLVDPPAIDDGFKEKKRYDEKTNCPDMTITRRTEVGTQLRE